MHHTAKIIWHFVLQAGTQFQNDQVLKAKLQVQANVLRRFVYQKAFAGVGPLNTKRCV